jgi:hypothetical protein
VIARPGNCALVQMGSEEEGRDVSAVFVAQSLKGYVHAVTSDPASCCAQNRLPFEVMTIVPTLSHSLQVTISFR